MKQRQRAPTTDDVIRMIQKDCERQAEQVHERLGEVVAALRDGVTVRALGALVGMENEIADLSAILKLLVRTPSGIRLEAPDIPPRRSPKRGDKRQ
jgi:dephospho-CoA kinase